MTVKRKKLLLLSLLALLVAPFVFWYGPLTTGETRSLGREVLRFHSLIEPSDPAKARTLSAEVTITPGKGLPDGLADHPVRVAYRFPDRLRLIARVDGKDYRIGRNGEEIWLHAPQKGLAVVGANDVPRFTSHPDSLQPVDLPTFTIPVKRWQLRLLPALVEIEENSDGKSTEFSFKNWARKRFDLPGGKFAFQATETGMPGTMRVATADLAFTADFAGQKIDANDPDTYWQIPRRSRQDRTRRSFPPGPLCQGHPRQSQCKNSHPRSRHGQPHSSRHPWRWSPRGNRRHPRAVSPGHT